MVDSSSKSIHTYTTLGGVKLCLRPISPVLVRFIQSDTFGRPQPPVITVKVGKAQKPVKQANPDDPDYKARLKAWDDAHNEKALIYIWSRGVASEVPADVEARLRELMPGVNADAIKYAWLLELMPDTKEMGILSNRIVGQSIATEEGIADAEARFPGEGERDVSGDVPASED